MTHLRLWFFLAIAGCLGYLNGLSAQDPPAASQEVTPAPDLTESQGTRCVSGIYPHLTTYAQSRVDGLFHRRDSSECGIGAIVPWAGKLWMVTYAPHRPLGSEHKLYSIDPKTLTMTIHKDSVGGTPAGRMIHVETQQLFIGHHVIDAEGSIRTIQPRDMPGRVTAWARHLSDPANKVYMYDMEGMLYEVDVRTLTVVKLFHNPVPGEHGKGAYTAQGKLVIANNGISGGHDPREHWRVQPPQALGPEDRGILATFDGTNWEIVEQRQYTDVTGPDGIAPSDESLTKPLWAIGWDKRSVRLQVLEGGVFHTYLLPKGCLNNDAAHGWFTEWPRIRDIGQKDLLMDMHGLFFDFPKDFRPTRSAGITPIGRHLRYVPDFCEWNGRLVLASDETSVQGNPLAGQPQSNLWIGKYEDLRTWGEASAAGSIWIKDQVKANEPSAPFLIHGFARRMAHFAAPPGTRCLLELDVQGDNRWTPYQTIAIPASGATCHFFPEDLEAEWIRVRLDRDCDDVSVAFHYTDQRCHDPKEQGKVLFDAIAEIDSMDFGPALHMFPAKKNRNLELVGKRGDQLSFAELNAETFAFAKVDGDDALRKKAITKPIYHVDDASVILEVSESIQGKKQDYRLRLPKGSKAFDQAFPEGWPRGEREVESERTLANIHGTFYEVPFWIVGEGPLFTKMKPVCSHNKRIDDFATWRGLLCLSGVRPDAQPSEHVVRSPDGDWALWIGGIDDLWMLGKPVGQGGPWKSSEVKANVPSDPYLMNGFDKKILTLKADRDCTIDVQIDFDLESGFHHYQSFEIQSGKERLFEFPAGFNAHWVRFVCNTNATVTAWLRYE